MSTPRRLARAFITLALLFNTPVAATAQDAPTAAVRAPAGTQTSPHTRVEFLLTGGKGRVAPELKREDLRLYVDGVERPILHFEKGETPVSYGLVVDNSGSLRSQIGRVAAAAKFIVGHNRPSDEAFVIRFVSSDNINLLQRLTGDRGALERALDSMFIQGGHTALLDALHLSGAYLIKNASRAGSPPRRLALVLVSDGEDRNSLTKAEQVTKLLADAGVEVFCIGLTGELERERGFVMGGRREKAKELLRKLAAATGGRAFFAEKDRQLEEAVGEVVSNLQTRYVLGFEPSAGVGAASRGKVEVKVVGEPGKAGLKAQLVTPALKSR